MADEQIIVDIKVQSSEVDAANKRIDTLTTSITELGNRISTARNQNKEYQKSQQELTKQYEQNKISADKYLIEIDKLNAKIQTNNKIIAQSSVEMSKQKNERNANIKLVNSEVGAYTRLSNQYTIAAKKAKDLAAQYGINSVEAKKAAASTSALGDRLKQIDASVGQNTRKVGSYSESLKGLGQQLLGAFGITAGIGLVVEGFRKLSERADLLITSNKKIQQTFDVTTGEAKKLSNQIIALANNFDEDYNEILKSANTVSKELGISAKQSLDLIEQGFKKGSNNTGEFLEILKEYPTQFKAAGIDAETMFAIINQQVKEGIYSDKGVDAIKEGGLRLRENTKAVQEALSPLDESVKLQIKQEIAAGNSFKAIQLVSKELRNTSLTAEQTQALIADVFGGAGEDAGLRYLQTLADIDTNLKNVADQTTVNENANLNLSKTWNSFVNSVLGSESILTKIWAGFKNTLAGALEILTNLAEAAGFGADETGKKLKRFTDRTTEHKKATDELAKSTKELTKEEKKAAEERDKANRMLLAEIEKNNIALIKDAQKRAKAELELWNKNEIDKINSSKASAEVRSEALLSQEQLYLDKVIALNVENQEKLSKLYNEDQIEEIDFLNELKLEKQEEFFDAQAEISENYRKIEEEKEAESEKRKQKIRSTIIESFEGYFKTLSDQKQDERINKIREGAKIQEDILKDQLDKGLITNEEYETKLAEINKKARIDEAKANKKKNIFQIGIDTLAAVIKTFANLGWPAGILPAIGVAAEGALNAGLVAATPIPSFGAGVSDIVNIGDSHASGNDVDVWGYSGSQKQYFGKVEKGEAMPVIRKSAANDYMISKLNGHFDSYGKKFANGTTDITSQGQSIDTAQMVNGIITAFNNVKIVAKIEDITKEAGRKIEIVNNSKV